MITMLPNILRKLKDVSGNGTLQEFHLFNTFPKEIREHIWEHALPGPRLVRVKTIWTPTNSQGAFGSSLPTFPVACHIVACIPALLTVNMEARTVAKIHYKLCFRGFMAYPQRAIYFNFDHDYLEFRHSSDVKLFYLSVFATSDDREKFKHSLKNLILWQPFVHQPSSDILTFTHLKALIFASQFELPWFERDRQMQEERANAQARRSLIGHWVRIFGFPEEKVPEFSFMSRKELLAWAQIELKEMARAKGEGAGFVGLVKKLF